MCALYHYPLYCYLRRRACAHHDAQDVLHDFLAMILRRHELERMDEAKGRLRGYLSTALGRFMHQWRQGEARRDERERGEAPLDFTLIERRYERERFTDDDTPDRIFDRKWALELLRAVMKKLAARYEERGRGAIFAALRPALEGGGSLRGEDTPALARQLGLTEEALRGAMSRLLSEFREQTQAEVRMTIENPDDLADEFAYLSGLFGR